MSNAKKQPSIKISRYDHPDQVGWSGYVKDEDQNWILFFGSGGRTVFYPKRNPDGSVQSDT